MKSCEPLLDAPIVRVAEHQDEYETVEVAQVTLAAYPVIPDTGYNTLVVAFEPTPEERRRIASGENIYVAQLTFGRPMTPILVTCGADETAAVFNVRSTA